MAEGAIANRCTAMTYRLALFTPETWKATQADGCTTVGFRRNQAALARVEPSDLLLCYIIGVSRWSGVLKVTRAAYECTGTLYDEPESFPLRLDVSPLVAVNMERAVPIQLPEVWSNLLLTKELPIQNSRWGALFRQTLRQIPREDGDFLLALLRRRKELEDEYELTSRDRSKLTALRRQKKERIEWASYDNERS